MRTVELNVLTIDELSPKALEKAHAKFNEHSSYPWGTENEDTLKAFENIFPVKVKDFQYGGGGCYVNFSMRVIDYNYDDEIEALTGVRLMKYIWNNYGKHLYKGKYYSTAGYYDENKKYHYRFRHSKCTVVGRNCVLTGFAVDDDILGPIYDFLEKPNNHETLKDIMHSCLQSWVSACNSDHEHYFSEENFIEEARETGQEFEEDGDIYKG